MLTFTTAHLYPMWKLHSNTVKMKYSALSILIFWGFCLFRKLTDQRSHHQEDNKVEASVTHRIRGIAFVKE